MLGTVEQISVLNRIAITSCIVLCSDNFCCLRRSIACDYFILAREKILFYKSEVLFYIINDLVQI
jgi:hypothetical protein